MTFTPYLQSSEYAAYGVPDANAAQIANACRIVNNFLSRSEGLLWSPDGNGTPAYMTNKQATVSFAAASPINPGANVNVTLPGAQFGTQNVGDVVVLDRLNAGITESCTVTAVNGNTLTLLDVQFAHAASCPVDFGLTILEELPLPKNRSVVRLSRTPVAQIVAGYGKYGYGRRSDQVMGYNNGLLNITQAFGGPPQWSPFPVGQTDINMATGYVGIPAGLLLAYFSDVRLHYVAGWSQANLPTDIKQAVASLVRSVIDSPFAANVKMMKAGDATLERFTASSIDKDIQSLLTPYKALVIG
jgi:hypothetical protein